MSAEERERRLDPHSSPTFDDALTLAQRWAPTLQQLRRERRLAVLRIAAMTACCLALVIATVVLAAVTALWMAGAL